MQQDTLAFIIELREFKTRYLHYVLYWFVGTDHNALEEGTFEDCFNALWVWYPDMTLSQYKQLIRYGSFRYDNETVYITGCNCSHDYDIDRDNGDFISGDSCEFYLEMEDQYQ